MKLSSATVLTGWFHHLIEEIMMGYVLKKMKKCWKGIVDLLMTSPVPNFKEFSPWGPNFPVVLTEMRYTGRLAEYALHSLWIVSFTLI